MDHSIPIQMRRPSRFILPLAILMLFLTGLYLYLTSQNSQSLPLSVHLEQSIGIDAPPDVYEDAIAYAIKNLAIELDIDVENYDLSMEDYQALVEAAASKFGDCLSTGSTPWHQRPIRVILVYPVRRSSSIKDRRSKSGRLVARKNHDTLLAYRNLDYFTS